MFGAIVSEINHYAFVRDAPDITDVFRNFYRRESDITKVSPIKVHYSLFGDVSKPSTFIFVATSVVHPGPWLRLCYTSCNCRLWPNGSPPSKISRVFLDPFRGQTFSTAITISLIVHQSSQWIRQSKDLLWRFCISRMARPDAQIFK